MADLDRYRAAGADAARKGKPRLPQLDDDTLDLLAGVSPERGEAIIDAWLHAYDHELHHDHRNNTAGRLQ